MRVYKFNLSEIRWQLCVVFLLFSGTGTGAAVSCDGGGGTRGRGVGGTGHSSGLPPTPSPIPPPGPIAGYGPDSLCQQLSIMGHISLIICKCNRYITGIRFLNHHVNCSLVKTLCELFIFTNEEISKLKLWSVYIVNRSQILLPSAFQSAKSFVTANTRTRSHLGSIFSLQVTLCC